MSLFLLLSPLQYRTISNIVLARDIERSAATARSKRHVQSSEGLPHGHGVRIQHRRAE